MGEGQDGRRTRRQMLADPARFPRRRVRGGAGGLAEACRRHACRQRAFKAQRVESMPAIASRRVRATEHLAHTRPDVPEAAWRCPRRCAFGSSAESRKSRLDLAAPSRAPLVNMASFTSLPAEVLSAVRDRVDDAHSHASLYRTYRTLYALYEDDATWRAIAYAGGLGRPQSDVVASWRKVVLAASLHAQRCGLSFCRDLLTEGCGAWAETLKFACAARRAAFAECGAARALLFRPPRAR